MRRADPLTLVVKGHAAFLAAVDLHVGGVQVDRDRPADQRPAFGVSAGSGAPIRSCCRVLAYSRIRV